MTGFTNLIYFTGEPESSIISLIESRGTTKKIKDDDGFLIDLTVKDSIQNGYSFRIYAGSPEHFEAHHIEEFRLKFGFVPTTYYGFMGWGNSKFEEQFVTRLMLEVLKISPGLVDLSAAVDKISDKPKGQIIELGYNSDDGKRRFTHVVDREFLENWIKNPSFYIPV